MSSHQRRATLAIACTVSVLGLAIGLADGGNASQMIQLAQATQKAAPGAPPRQTETQPGPAGESEAQIADLRKRLNITTAQQPQFDALAQAMRQNAQELDALVRQAQGKGKPNAVDAMRTAADFAEAEAAGMKRLLPPLQSLYDSLSDQQKRAADQVFAAGPEASPPPQQQPQGKRR